MSFTNDAIIMIYDIIDANISITGFCAFLINENIIYNAAKIKVAGAVSLPSYLSPAKSVCNISKTGSDADVSPVIAEFNMPEFIIKPILHSPNIIKR